MTGIFIRPAGRMYAYCLEIVRIIPAGDDRDGQWQCRRRGMDERRNQIDDERGHAMHYLPMLRKVAPGVWKDDRANRWFGMPRYYRELRQTGQLALGL